MTSICLLCENNSVETVLNLGEQPLPSVLSKNIEIAKYPLELVFCSQCFSLQIKNPLQSQQIFPENFSYFSSCSDSIVEHSTELANKVIKLMPLNNDSSILEIGCNDGVLLNALAASGAKVYGIEPTPKPAEQAIKKGFNINTRFFNLVLAEQLLSDIGKQDLIISNNVFAHCSNLNDIFSGINLLLSDTGLLVFEVHYIRSVIEKSQFDTIYHEHIFYHSLTTLNTLLKKHDFTIAQAELISPQGGSIRVYAKRKNDTRDYFAGNNNLEKYLREEEKAGIKSIGYYQSLKKIVTSTTSALINFIEQEIDKGRTFCAYGAAAKGTMFINHCGLTQNQIKYIVDKNDFKQNKYLPGTDIPVKGVETLYKEACDYCLILPWNIKDEVIKQEKQFTANGGIFFTAIPCLTLL